MREIESKDVSLPELGIFATLKQRVDGGPMRTAADVSQKRSVGRYASKKNGRGQFHESLNELHAFYGAEVNTDVVRYRAQPHKLEFVIDGARRSYTPDREDTLSNRHTEIVEVKGRYDAEKDPDYHAKLEISQMVYAGLGWSFRVTERDEIEAQPRYRALELIQSLRRTVVTQLDEDWVQRRFAGDETLPLAKIRELWDSPVLGFAKMCALMVKRTISIDIDHGLSDAAPVRLLRA